MYKYTIVCFNETNKVFHFLVESADGYCAEIEVRKRFPNYNFPLSAAPGSPMSFL